MGELSYLISYPGACSTGYTKRSVSSPICAVTKSQYSPTVTPVTTSQTPPLRSNSILKLSSLEVGFSRSSWLISGRTEYDMSDVDGWAWVRTTVSAEFMSNVNLRRTRWKERDYLQLLGPVHRLGSLSIFHLRQRGNMSDLMLRLTTSRSYTSIALCVAVDTGYSCMIGNELMGRSSTKVDGMISGVKPYPPRVQSAQREVYVRG
jgi:hypothetical protein